MLLVRVWMFLSLVGCAQTIRAGKGLPAFEAGLGQRFTERVAMSDGVELVTHVRLPRGDGPWPVVLTRTAYPFAVIAEPRCKLFNRYGYACIWQATRGRLKSGGEWSPLIHEVADGYDTLAWLDEQPWQNHHVALYGESYMAGVQFAVGEALPPQVKTLVPMVFGTNPYELMFQGGMVRHEIATAWMSLMPDERFHMLRAGAYRRALKAWPRLRLDEVAAGKEVPWFRFWVQHDDPADPFWTQGLAGRFAHVPEKIDVPILMLGGWADAFLGPQVETWQQLGSKSSSVFVVGPWGHLGFELSDLPLRGIKNHPIGLDGGGRQWRRVLDWLDHHLKGEPLQYGRGQVVRWVQGDGWKQSESWPPETAETTWMLGGGEDARACLGELSSEAELAPISWVHDPQNPVPTKGGAGMLASALWGGYRSSPRGARHQGRLCERRDDLMGFRTAPLSEALPVAGRLRVMLELESEAAETALVVNVLEETATGKRIHVVDGIATAHPGATTEVVTWPIEWSFQPGSRVLVQVASSSFPKWESHPNVAGPWMEVMPEVATHTLVSGRVALPVVVGD